METQAFPLETRMLPRAYATAASEHTVAGMTREQACSQYQKKILAIARRVHEHVNADGCVQLEDLVSYGVLGLLEAFERFSGEHNVEFAEFAEYRIRGAMLDALRTMDTFTRRRRQTSRRLAVANDKARAELGREPAPQEVAKAMGVGMDEYWQARDVAQPVKLVSVESATDDDGSIRHALNPTAANFAPVHIAAEESREALRAAIQALPERERQVVLLYYGRDLSLAEIGETFGVSPSRICQVLSVARGKLRAALAASIDHDAVAASEGAA